MPASIHGRALTLTCACVRASTRRVLAMAAAAAAGYHLLQLLKCLYLGRAGAGGVNPCRRSSRALAWACLLLDKVSLAKPTPSSSLLLDLLSEGRISLFLLSEKESSNFRWRKNKRLSCCYSVYRLTIDRNVIKSYGNHKAKYAYIHGP